MLAEIKSIEDVVEFFTQLLDEGLNYHPDDNFRDYINIETGKPSYTAQEALIRNNLNDQCFSVCEVAVADIYNISMEIYLKETGLNKYFLLPSQVYHE